MRRPYPEHAYSDAPRARCAWPETVDTPLAWPKLTQDHQTDVAIIGAGVTGANAALALAERGLSVTLLDARHPLFGASGRNGGFCCLGGAKATDAALRARFGEDQRRAYRRAERAAVDHVADLAQRLSLDIDRHSDGETMLAHSPRTWAQMQSEAQDLARDYDTEVDLTPRDGLRQSGLHGPFHGAMTLRVGFGLNPAKYLAGLLTAAQKAGAQAFGDSPVTHLGWTRDGYTLTANGHTIRAGKVVLAMNGYAPDSLLSWLAGRFLPAQSAVLVTAPIPEALAQEAGWTTRQMAYTSREFLHYFRRMPDGRMLFGMRGSLLSSVAADRRAEARLRRAFARMFPALAQLGTLHVWSGLVCLTRDLTPFCGPVPDHPGLFAAFGYHGNGVAMGSYCGALLADLIADGRMDKPTSTVLTTPPPRFPGGRFRRHLLWPAYGIRMMQDAL
ncbi:NAD(P)/FAD-dependent oxidoreductase [Pseudaestuariivita sp.]|uniref:NAD(P)/FAD-dependent oxidoreductase n=1 Tax=Pseudaestuariivita sp. TaxID=2211669 RepID=UPI004059C8CD